MKIPLTFSELLQAYFTQRLMHERAASPRTKAIETLFVCSLPLPSGV